MAFTNSELASIADSTLQFTIDKGKLWKQNVSNKPLLDALNANAGQFIGGDSYVKLGVKPGQGGGGLVGYTHDDQVSYYNPATNKVVRFPWREHHIGVTVTHTELKVDGIEVVEDGAGEEQTREVSGREEIALANRLNEKMDDLNEDYAFSLDRLLHGDGTSDAKAIAGIDSLILASPATGTTGGLNRATTAWWRNRAATAAFAAAGGQGAITSSTANGGALIEFLDKEMRQLNRYKNGSTRHKFFAGSDFIDAYKKELRANGNYTMNGWSAGTADGSMPNPQHGGTPFTYDPTLDDLGRSKRCYVIDTGRAGVRLLYLNGKRMLKHKPDRPADRYVIYSGITMTGVLVAKQLNTSGVYDIA